jgi:ribosomal protein S18 acetylase RimI-like enzyme
VKPQVTVRPIIPSDRQQWAGLFRGYREFYRLAPDETVVDRVWDWLSDDSHEVNAFVAVTAEPEEAGVLVGLAHYRRFSRPSSGTAGIYLDDLFADPDVRGRGIGRALLAELAALAAAENRSVVRWITAEDNVTARRLYDAVAKATPWVTYDMLPG